MCDIAVNILLVLARYPGALQFRALRIKGLAHIHAEKDNNFANWR